MSKKYNAYLKEHIKNVRKGYEWMRTYIPEVLDDSILAFAVIGLHDDSKYSTEEYVAYDKYFYGEEQTETVKADFNLAWLNHIHQNKHHWQHWVLINDEASEGMVAIDMPSEYIIEMICDWWSFSWSKGNLYEIFDWYKEHKRTMILSDATRRKVENILNCMHDKLDTLTNRK